jgi:hypothetical protein
MYCFFCFGQKSGPNANALQQVFTEEPSYWQKDERQKLVQWQERILVHVDKNFVKEEESLFFKAYVLTGPNRIRATISKVLKVELLDDQKQVLRTQYHEITDGMAVGAFVMPKKLKEGEYTLRAYTRWMQNYGDSFYSHTLLQNETASSSESIDKNEMESLKISFYPEGNQLIEQLDNWLLIKATTEGNQHLDIKGQIIDENNEVIVAATAYGEGLTSVVFNPQPGKKYRYRVESGQTFDLPPIQQKGYALKVNNLNKTDLDIQIATSPSLLNSKVWIKGEMSGITYFKKEMHVGNSLETIEVPKEGIPFGIMTITILNQQEDILAKRPVRINPSEHIKMTMLDRNINRDKGEISLKLKVTDKKGNPISSEIALSVINIPEENQIQKLGYRLDTNEADGILNINRKERFKEDLALLTSELYMTEELQSVPSRIKYPFQEGLDLFGYAYNLDNELLRNTAVQIIGSSADNVLAKEIITDDTGLIKMENLQLSGETDLIFRTPGDNSSSRLVKFVPFQEEYKSNSSSRAVLDFKKQRKGEVTQSSPWEYLDSEELVELNEVVVVEEKLNSSRSKPSVYGVTPAKIIYQDKEKPKTLPQLFLTTAGINVVNLGGLNPELRLPAAAGAGPVLWVVDGMPMMNQGNSLMEVMNVVSFVDIERIEVLYGSEAAIYGSRASGGAILVYTRSAANLDYVNRKEGRLKFQGYHQSENFNSVAKIMEKKPKRYRDQINTIFWEPKLRTNEDGEVFIKFNTAIPIETIMLKATTVTAEGAVGNFTTVD